MRFTGLSFSYNCAYAVFGGLTPPLVSLLLPMSRLAPAHYVAAACALGLGMALLQLRKPVGAPGAALTA